MNYTDGYFFQRDMETATNWVEQKTAGLDKKTLLIKISTENRKIERYYAVELKHMQKLNKAQQTNNQKDMAKYRNKLDHNRLLIAECHRKVYDYVQIINAM